MTDLRKAAEEALYALELNTGCGFDHVIEALRQALAAEKALDEMVAINQRLGLYDDKEKNNA